MFTMNPIPIMRRSSRKAVEQGESRSECDPRFEHERGAALIEAAFVTMLLISLLVGTVTSGIAFSQKTSLQTAAREATRFGATLPVNGDMNKWLTSVLNIAKSAAKNDLSATTAGQNICVAYVYPKGTTPADRNSRLMQTGGVTGSVTTGAAATCFSDGRPDDERRIQVVTGRTATIQAAVFSVDVDLSSQSSARFERTN
jgi:Flp pilus assembly protein TadG